MKLSHFLIILLSLIATSLYAQDEHDHVEHHNHDDHHEHHDGEDHHDHHKNEIGIAHAAVYFVKEKEVSYGLHVHYVYTFAESKFGAGLSFENIFDEHQHRTFGILASYRPLDKLSFNVSPGITFEGASSSDPIFALHIETSYEFEIHNFHVGPVLEYAYDPNDSHMSIGLHVGYGF
ncbi:MAG: hypothetical protein HRT71_02835 [Flavobacteriales bacterium]|nr:hypothetical protein [Flavobacteriales bacterium]